MKTCEHLKEVGCIKDVCSCNTGPKQKTLEETAERLQKDKYGVFISKNADVKGQLVIDTANAAFLSGMKEGARWQQKQNNNEALEFGRWIIQNPDFQNNSSWSLSTAKYNFEQFKKQKL